MGPGSRHTAADVLAFARTLAGEKAVVLVLNNQRSSVELASLDGGGVDVGGLLNDAASVIEITDNTGASASLRVANGRLVGTMPALTALMLAGP